jgi:hypothetical protein
LPFFCPPPGDSDGKRDGYGERDGFFMIVMRSVTGVVFFTIAYGQDGNMEKSPCQALCCNFFTPFVTLFNIKVTL